MCYITSDDVEYNISDHVFITKHIMCYITDRIVCYITDEIMCYIT